MYKEALRPFFPLLPMEKRGVKTVGIQMGKGNRSACNIAMDSVKQHR